MKIQSKDHGLLLIPNIGTSINKVGCLLFMRQFHPYFFIICHRHPHSVILGCSYGNVANFEVHLMAFFSVSLFMHVLQAYNLTLNESASHAFAMA